MGVINPEFYADCRSKEIVQKKCAKKSYSLKTDFLGTFCRKIIFRDYLFVIFFLIIPSDLNQHNILDFSYTPTDLFQKNKFELR
jgi:hypothetical protein